RQPQIMLPEGPAKNCDRSNTRTPVRGRCMAPLLFNAVARAASAVPQHMLCKRGFSGSAGLQPGPRGHAGAWRSQGNTQELLWRCTSSIHVDYLLHRQWLQAQQGVDNPRIFPYNEHASQNWLMVPGELVG